MLDEQTKCTGKGVGEKREHWQALRPNRQDDCSNKNQGGNRYAPHQATGRKSRFSQSSSVFILNSEHFPKFTLTK